jgi:hypothetical protein
MGGSQANRGRQDRPHRAKWYRGVLEQPHHGLLSAGVSPGETRGTDLL